MSRFRPLSLRALVASAAVIGVTLLLCQVAGAGAVRRLPALAKRQAVAQAKPPAPVRQQPAVAPGWVVAIDPLTGQFVMPTPEQMLELSQPERTGLLRTSAGLSEVTLSDGTVMLDLQGRFMEYAVVRLDPSGRPRFGCVNDPRSLLLWLVPGAPAPTTVLEEK